MQFQNAMKIVEAALAFAAEVQKLSIDPKTNGAAIAVVANPSPKVIHKPRPEINAKQLVFDCMRERTKWCLLSSVIRYVNLNLSKDRKLLDSKVARVLNHLVTDGLLMRKYDGTIPRGQSQQWKITKAGKAHQGPVSFAGEHDNKQPTLGF